MLPLSNMMNFQAILAATQNAAMIVSLRNFLSPSDVQCSSSGFRSFLARPCRIVDTNTITSHAAPRAITCFSSGWLKCATTIRAIGQVLFPHRIASCLPTDGKNLSMISVKTPAVAKPLPITNRPKYSSARFAWSWHIWVTGSKSWLSLSSYAFSSAMSRAKTDREPSYDARNKWHSAFLAVYRKRNYATRCIAELAPARLAAKPLLA